MRRFVIRRPGRTVCRGDGAGASGPTCDVSLLRGEAALSGSWATSSGSHVTTISARFSGSNGSPPQLADQPVGGFGIETVVREAKRG